MNALKRILFCDPAEDGRACRVLHWALNLLCLVLWSLGVGLVSLYLGKVGHGPALWAYYLTVPALLVLNTLPVLLLALALLLIFNRVWPAVLGSGAVVVLLALVNYFKLMFRSEPLLLSDLHYASEAASISRRYHVFFSPGIVLCLAAVAAGTVLAFFLLRARFRRGRYRALWALALAAVTALLLHTVYGSFDLYQRLAPEETGGAGAEALALSEYNAADRYCARGFLYPLLYDAANGGVWLPENYSAAAARSELAALPDADIPAEKRVHFVALMLEAYNDFSLYGELFPFARDPYAFFHALQRQSYHGPLVTNVFSAGTINTERSFLTGATKMFDYRAAAWSYVRYFNRQGYRSIFCHPGYSWFYDRENVMDYLGFDQLYFYENRFSWMPEDWDAIMDDAVFFPELTAIFDAEAARAEGPLFQFAVSFQNHSPYEASFLLDPEHEYIPQGNLSWESYCILNNYFRGIRATDDALQQLVSYFALSGEPVVLVLFGDHKPWLGDAQSVYRELGIDLSQRTEESFYNYYTTQYTVWANDAARAALGFDLEGEGEALSPCFLMTRIFDLCGFDGPGFMQAERELLQRVTVVNDAGRYVENGVLTDTLSPQAQELLDRLRRMQYYCARDWAKEADIP